MPTVLEQLQYGFDRDSRRTWRRRSLTSGEDNHYGYDGLSQVVGSSLGNLNLNQTAIGAIPSLAESFNYDPTGNWKGYTIEADGAVTLDQHRVHDKGNRLTQIEDSPNPFLLDRVGRMTEMAPDASGNWNESLTLKWDAWSRITEVRRASDDSVLGTYTYDGLTRRMTRHVSGLPARQTIYSDTWRPLEERFLLTPPANTVAAQYLWGARHRDDLVRRDRAIGPGQPLTETRYVLMDYYSPAAITDETGAVTERFAFSAFGVRRILAPDFSPRSTSECGFDFAFQGQFLDTESGLLNYGYRYYSPLLGRWTCKDPIQEQGGLNLYAMAGNDAVDRVDRLGLIGSLGIMPDGNGGYRPTYPPIPPPSRPNRPDPDYDLLDDTPNPPSPECPAIDGYYRHCVQTCRLNRYLNRNASIPQMLAIPIAYAAALAAGNDVLSDHERDREANCVGIGCSLMGLGCESACANALKAAHAKDCCQIKDKERFDKGHPLCCEKKK